MSKQIPLVDYLVLGDDPHLVAHECKRCGARYFDRRNACASCEADEFANVDVPTTGEVRAFTIVSLAALVLVTLPGGGTVLPRVINAQVGGRD